MKKQALLIFLAGILLASPGLAQGVYKWTDKNGKVHYGDMPTTSNVKQVDTKPTMKGTVKPAPKCPYAKN